jgi:hypothetical protein
LEYDWTLSAPYPMSTQVAAPPELPAVSSGQIADSMPDRPQRQSGDGADVCCISQKSRTGDDEQTRAVSAGLPERQLYAEANQVVGGYQALEPGRKVASLDWVAEP